MDGIYFWIGVKNELTNYNKWLVNFFISFWMINWNICKILAITLIHIIFFSLLSSFEFFPELTLVDQELGEQILIKIQKILFLLINPHQASYCLNLIVVYAEFLSFHYPTFRDEISFITLLSMFCSNFMNRYLYLFCDLAFIFLEN